MKCCSSVSCSQGVKEMRCLKTQYCYIQSMFQTSTSCENIWIRFCFRIIVLNQFLDQPFNSKWGEGIWHLEFCDFAMYLMNEMPNALQTLSLHICTHPRTQVFQKKTRPKDLNFWSGGGERGLGTSPKIKVLALYKNNTAWREKTVVRVPLSFTSRTQRPVNPDRPNTEKAAEPSGAHNKPPSLGLLAPQPCGFKRLRECRNGERQNLGGSRISDEKKEGSRKVLIVSDRAWYINDSNSELLRIFIWNCFAQLFSHLELFDIKLFPFHLHTCYPKSLMDCTTCCIVECFTFEQWYSLWNKQCLKL